MERKFGSNGAHPLFIDLQYFTALCSLKGASLKVLPRNVWFTVFSLSQLFRTIINLTNTTSLTYYCTSGLIFLVFNDLTNTCLVNVSFAAAPTPPTEYRGYALMWLSHFATQWACPRRVPPTMMSRATPLYNLLSNTHHVVTFLHYTLLPVMQLWPSPSLWDVWKSSFYWLALKGSSNGAITDRHTPVFKHCASLGAACFDVITSQL